MTSDELIEYAKQNYPLGSKCVSAINNGYTTILDKYSFAYNLSTGDLVCTNKNGNRWSIYSKGNWSKILQYPKDYSPKEEFENYEL